MTIENTDYAGGENMFLLKLAGETAAKVIEEGVEKIAETAAKAETLAMEEVVRSELASEAVSTSVPEVFRDFSEIAGDPEIRNRLGKEQLKQMEKRMMKAEEGYLLESALEDSFGADDLDDMDDVGALEVAERRKKNRFSDSRLYQISRMGNGCSSFLSGIENLRSKALREAALEKKIEALQTDDGVKSVIHEWESELLDQQALKAEQKGKLFGLFRYPEHSVKSIQEAQYKHTKI